MVGLYQDLIQIKMRVMEKNSSLQIIPIVGMGGIGKTTLAKSVYQSSLIVEHFDFLSWVTVSQEYDIHKILLGITVHIKVKLDHEFLPESEYNRLKKEDVASLAQFVYRSLFGRRFLIVLDDTWHAGMWDNIRRALPDNCNGSRIVLTTRLQEVAIKIDSRSLLHQMQLLTEDQSWDLFKQEVCGQDHCPQELQGIAKMISRNCKGLPLAIVVIARLLKLNMTYDYWEKFATNIKEAAAAATTSGDDDDELFGILALSYDNLPHHLKTCFLYTSIFPEDHEIPVKRLVRLWVAEGFLRPRSNKRIEEVAEEYLVDLVERNLLLVTKKRSNGRIRTCSIHDVLRELSLRKAQDDKFLQHFNGKRYVNHKTDDLNTLPKYCRRISISHVAHESLKDHIHYLPVRSILFFYPCTRMYLPIAEFRLLRILDAFQVKFIPFNILPVLDFINLRYLSFTFMGEYCHDLELIYNLKNLETLIVGFETSVYRPSYPLSLNVCILTLPKLRHFVLIGKYTVMYGHLDALQAGYPIPNSLQTLSGVNNLRFTPGAVARFANLQKLKVRYCEVMPGDWEGICLGNLINLEKLEELNFMVDEARSKIPVLLRTNLAFPPTLKKITLTRSGIPWLDMSVIGTMPNLQVLKLLRGSFIGPEWESNEGEFQMLKYLKLEIEDLVQWRAESTHFPSLTQLVVSRCYKLKEIPSEIGDIATLQKLMVLICNNRTEYSARRILEEQQSYGNYFLQVFIQTENKNKDTM